jgi:hypothetical protein
VKEKDTSVLFHPAALAAGLGVPKANVGAVLSILKDAEVNVALLPALSVTITVPVTEFPSVASTKGLTFGVVVSTPDRLSEAVKDTDTSVLFQPAAFAAGLAAPKTKVGPVVSILIAFITLLALFPALSVHVPATD